MRVRFVIQPNVPSINHGQYAFTANLIVDDMVIGRCCLKHIRHRLYETHSSLQSTYHGKGFGVKMYLRAIALAKSKGYRVCSSTIDQMTLEAFRLWNSKRLRKKYRVYERANRFWVEA